ncbi:MAG: DUF2283 domain-containing protein [Mucilaginibacter sp.]|uniref:DUF2283 domain-containing protein n=1 Tax=Mucilaginibacter sp. TaxID=1882438 RepID=UPI0032642115
MEKRKTRTKINEVKQITLKLAITPTTGYVSLPNHPHTVGCVDNTIQLDQLIEAYKGPSIYLDFNKSGELIGIEILG